MKPAGRYHALLQSISVCVVVLVALLRAGAAHAAFPFLPQHAKLEATLRAASHTEALHALYAYAADPGNENPAACEAFDLDRQIGKHEAALVALVAIGHAPLHPATVFHCRTAEPRTTLCNGVVADDTVRPGVVLPLTRGRYTARLHSRLPRARLLGLYVTTLKDAFAARPVRRVEAGREITIAARPHGTVLIALFSASAPFKVRKFVWYH
jgi:hypothetical protein